MAARYSIQTFTIHNTSTNAEETIQQGATRDSVTHWVVLNTPASFWSTTPLVVGSQIHPKLAAYLVAYPNT